MSAPAPQPPESTVPQHYSTLIYNAFGIVAALAWADALSGFFQSFDVSKRHPLFGPFMYAALVTLFAWFVGHWLSNSVKLPCTRLCDDPRTVTRSPEPGDSYGTTATPTK